MDFTDKPKDWKAYAQGEATAILNAVGVVNPSLLTRRTLRDLLAATWLQGVDYGAHVTVHTADNALEDLRRDLAS